MTSRAEQWQWAIVGLLREVNLCRPDELPKLVKRVTGQLSREFTIYLVDYEQQTLRELTATGAGDSQPVSGSIAGLAFQQSKVLAEPQNPRIVWIPLVDSTERLGVLRIESEVPEPATAFGAGEPGMQFANLLGHLIAAKLPYGDRLNQVRSSQPMSVNAVLLRQLLPPSTCTTEQLVISASMQPAYVIGGDAYDYSVDVGTAYIGIFDGVGHGLLAGLTIAVALSAIRAARRAGEDLTAMTLSADEHLEAQFPTSEFVTAILMQMDLSSGILRYINAGHPAGVVFSKDGSTAVLDGGRRLPLGVLPESVRPAEHRLRPGDRILLYTDGAVEARDHDGDFYTPERLIDHARRLGVENETVPETARKLNEDVILHHHGPPDDDSTIVVCEWSRAAPERTLPQ
jgi:hypothetical protein